MMRLATSPIVRCLVALLACPVIHVRAADIEWNANWKAGERAVYEVERCRRSSDPAKPTNNCAKGRLEIAVLRADDKGSLQQWKSDTAFRQLAEGRMTPEAIAAMEKAQNLAAEIEFDASAQPVRLVNAKDVRAMLDSAMHALTEPSPGRKELDPKVVEQVRAAMSQLTAHDERLLALAAKDATVLYSPLGGSFTPGKTVQLESSIPSPFGTAPLQSTLSLTTRVTDASRKTMELQLDEEIDRRALLEAMDSLVTPLIASAGGAEKAKEVRAAMSTMTLRRTTTYQVNLGSSWATSVRTRQTLDISGRQRVDTAEFRRIR
ncbi:hypothetical protein [Piscinibacter sp. XHJ-5]|uniref:hypothetical protein n=1 Tax=Piscinibacter sp. XHJ-5 TaxID=3037797 RepID=UPI0024528D77|nr:hypothetical protein [Piscinibacter sp. XHJ-5]